VDIQSAGARGGGLAVEEMEALNAEGMGAGIKRRETLDGQGRRRARVDFATGVQSQQRGFRRGVSLRIEGMEALNLKADGVSHVRLAINRMKMNHR
jgi:hypothetical protein